MGGNFKRRKGSNGLAINLQAKKHAALKLSDKPSVSGSQIREVSQNVEDVKMASPTGALSQADTREYQED